MRGLARQDRGADWTLFALGMRRDLVILAPYSLPFIQDLISLDRHATSHLSCSGFPKTSALTEIPCRVCLTIWAVGSCVARFCKWCIWDQTETDMFGPRHGTSMSRISWAPLNAEAPRIDGPGVVDTVRRFVDRHIVSAKVVMRGLGRSAHVPLWRSTVKVHSVACFELIRSKHP